ncbi:MAG: hypothetical protein IJ200_00995 [Prevotella sp.]|nr:hypothetical protein [Prevotella sp.]
MPKIQFYAVNDQRSTAPKQGYWLRPMRLQKIDSKTLAKHVEMDSHIDHARVEYIMASVVKQIREMVLNGHRVQLGELGTVELACHGSCSDSEQELSAKKNVKRLEIKLKPSADLKRAMQEIHLELTTTGDADGRKRDEHGAVVIED